MHVHVGRCVLTSCLHHPAAAVCAQVSGWLWFVVQLLSSLVSPSTDTPTHFSIDSHPTLEDINKFIAREVPSSATISGAPTTDDKQLSSVTISEIHPDKPLVPILEQGVAATPHHDDSTPPTSTGEMECLP